ncbi:transcriptional corepressor SEUSS [Trifolium repens]|nr:transcriptional corepressor SEUSS [Trifolium repens]
MCARRLTYYMYQQQHRPEDNNIEFWRKFVAEYFAPNAKKKWCVSMYGSSSQTTGVFPQLAKEGRFTNNDLLITPSQKEPSLLFQIVPFRAALVAICNTVAFRAARSD